MARHRSSKQFGSLILALLVVLSSFFSSMTQAAMISSDQVINEALELKDRQAINDFLSQADAQDALLALGVDPALAQERVERMTASELQSFHQQLEAQQAGGTSVVGVILVVFFILVMLDLLGATDLFPAIKPINTN